MSEPNAACEDALYALCFAREAALLPGLDPRRQRVYRGLVRQGASRAIRDACPLSLAVLGPTAFATLIDAFLAETGLQTPLYREIPVEFGAFVLSRVDAEPGAAPGRALAELIHFETLEVDVLNAPAPAFPAMPLSRSPIDDGTLVLCPSARLVTYQHAVHEAKSGTGAPRALDRPVALLVWRSAERFRVRLLDAMVALTLVGDAQGHSLRAAILEATRQTNGAMNPRAVRAVLVDLMHAGAIIGFLPHAAGDAP